jgi:hypothetical protein
MHEKAAYHASAGCVNNFFSIFVASARRPLHMAQARMPVSRGYFFKSAVQLVTRVSGLRALSAVIVLIRNLCPSAETQ